MKRTSYRCQECGYLSPQWMGRCPNCGRWDSFEKSTAQEDHLGVRVKPLPLAEVELEKGGRFKTGIEEFDRILGGRVIPGSLILIGGEPGVGKSTLMLQVADKLSQLEEPIIYVSGEESPGQIKLRANRLNLEAPDKLLVLSEQHLSLIQREVREANAAAMVVDSIQAVFPSGEEAPVHLHKEPGGTRQVGAATFELSHLAREQKIPIFLIGHITKSGDFAGPKAIEHMVDVVLYLEGGSTSSGRDSDIRLLRAVKNRYGSIDEVGVFQMKEDGLEEVVNPSKFFTGRSSVPKPGSVIVPSLEGTRPILVEIQALVSSSRYSGGFPQRRSTGLDYNRVALLLAVIEKRLGLHIGGEDVYLNVAGGLSIRETAADLGVVGAVVSSFKDRPINHDTVMVGEVSLSGEVRRVKRVRERLAEAEKLGYKRAIVPWDEQVNRGVSHSIINKHEVLRPQAESLEVIPVRDIEEAMECLL